MVLPVVLVSAALWAAGLWAFVHAGMPRRRKLAWTGLLIAVGVGIGAVLPLPQIWTKFLWIMAVLPLVAAVDVFLLRGNRSLLYWIRACGFEVVTAFAAATATRYVLGVMHVPATIPRFLR